MIRRNGGWILAALVPAALAASAPIGHAESSVMPQRATPLPFAFRSNRALIRRRNLGAVPAAVPTRVAPPEPFREDDFNSCKKLPRGKHNLPVSLKPDTDVTQLIIWISSITCKAFVLSSNLGASHRKVTILVPSVVTPKQAFRIFLDALNSVGLTVEPFGRFYQVIETARAKSKPIPLYGLDGRRLVYTR
jgi:hypothetical protein